MVRLLQDRVMVEFIDDDSEKVSAGGIILPGGDQDSREKKYPTQGLIVAVGPGKKYGEELVPVSLKVDSQVIYDRYNHSEAQYESPDGDKRKRFLVMREEFVVAIVYDGMDVVPLWDYVLVERAPGEVKRPSGLILPEAEKRKSLEGLVVGAGSGARVSTGAIRPMEVKTGDRVLFGKYDGTELTVGRKSYLVLKETSILGVLQREARREGVSA